MGSGSGREEREVGEARVERREGMEFAVRGIEEGVIGTGERWCRRRRREEGDVEEGLMAVGRRDAAHAERLRCEGW